MIEKCFNNVPRVTWGVRQLRWVQLYRPFQDKTGAFDYSELAGAVQVIAAQCVFNSGEEKFMSWSRFFLPELHLR
jgi:hypothetical protein